MVTVAPGLSTRKHEPGGGVMRGGSRPILTATMSAAPNLKIRKSDV